MITRKNLGPFLLNEEVEQLLKERDAYRELAAKKFHEVNIGEWGIDSSYEITDAEAQRILEAKGGK